MSCSMCIHGRTWQPGGEDRFKTARAILRFAIFALGASRSSRTVPQHSTFVCVFYASVCVCVCVFRAQRGVMLLKEQSSDVLVSLLLLLIRASTHSPTRVFFFLTRSTSCSSTRTRNHEKRQAYVSVAMEEGVSRRLALRVSTAVSVSCAA